ncbi:glycosyltransferase family 8 protein [Elizabethkingia anophelis]
MLLSEVPVVLAFTPNYFVPAATCLYSILKHSAETENFHVICLLTEELPQQMKDKLQRLGNGRIRYSYIDLNGKLQGIYVDDRYTIAASYRLLLPDLLPEYNKVMYIDCDVIVRNNLYKLYQETDLGNNYLAAVFEASLDFQIPYIMSIGCEPGRYINSGFLIMNLEKLRKENMVAKFLEAARVEGLQFPDQDVLNQLCKGYILAFLLTIMVYVLFFYHSIKNIFLNTIQKKTGVKFSSMGQYIIQELNPGIALL